MSSSKDNNNSWIKNALHRLVTQPTAIPPFLQYFMTLFEFFTFTIFISSNSLIGKSLIFGQVIQRNMIILLLLMFVLRYLTRLEIIKSIYVILIVWNVQCQFGIMAIIVYFLIFLHLCIDVVSKIEFSFQTKNIHSSTYPWLIAMHYIAVCSLTVLRFVKLPQSFVFPLIEIGTALIMLILQQRTIYKYEDFKNIHLRFYFLTAFYAIGEIYQIFVSPQPLWKSIFAILASQLLHQFIQWKFHAQFTLQEYISKKLETQAGFFVFSFIYSKKQVNRVILKALKTLANEDTNCLIEQKTFKQALMSNTKRALNEDAVQQNKKSETKQAAHRLISIIKQKSSIYSQLLIAQLCLFEHDQHVRCRQILTKLFNKSKWYNILSRILINKIEKKLLAHLRIQHDKRVSPMFYEFIQNDHFRNLLLKSSINFIQLWEYTKVKEGIYKRINELAERVINGQQKIHSCYKNLKTKCIKINLLYASYLFLVQRNTIKANEIMQKLYLYQQKQENLESDNKVYLKITVQFHQPLRIQAVGSNINKHLGYDKRSVIGLAVNNLLPQFYKEYHDKLMTDVLQNETPRLFLFTKTTIVKHSKGNYVVGLFCMRITFDFEGNLYLHGFIKIDPDERHNWHNYLFVRNSTRQIVECSVLVNDKISSTKGKRFSADQFFDDLNQKDFWTKIQKFTSDLNQYYYQPVISFDTNEDENDKVTMFVELDPLAESIVVHKVGSGQKQVPAKRKNLIPEMIVYPKYKVFENIKQFLRLKISTKETLDTLKKKIMIFVFIMVVMVIGIYVLQGVNILNVNDEYNTKIQTMLITDNIVKHYMGLSKIGVDLSYLVVNELYGYQYPDFKINLKENVMTVQETNLYFKPYAISTWVYESLSSVQQYRSCYQFVTQVLAAALFVDQAPNDKQVRANMIGSYNQLFTQTFVWSYPQYTTRIQEKLGQNSANRDIYQIIKIIILTVISVVLYVFIIKLQKSIRLTEHQSLQFISSLTFQQQIIQKTKDFIYVITQQKIQALITTNKSAFGGMRDFNPQNTKMSQMSARQSTGRDLMGNMSGRDTIRTAQNPPQQTSDTLLSQNSQIKLKPANKVFIILPLVMLLLILALQVFNYVINVKLRQINEAQSSKNIVEWMNKPLYFTRLVNAFLTEDRGPQFTDHDNTFYKVYKAFQSSYNNVASFNEISYDQFSDFEEKLRKIRFEYLCTYASCPSFDKDYVNILYTTTMQKLAQYMLANQYFLNDPNNKMNTIMASEQLFREIMTDLIYTYIKDYKQFANNYKTNQMMFIIIIFVVLSLLALMLTLQIFFNVYRSLIKHIRICDIVKQSSYLIKIQDLISFEQEKLQRQKTEKKNKQGKKKNKDKINESKDLKNQNSEILDENQKQISQRNSPRWKKQQQPPEILKDRKRDGKDRKTSIFKQIQRSKNK